MRSLEEIMEKDRVRKKDVPILTLIEIGGPATARQISEASDLYGGVSSTEVARTLRIHPDILVIKDEKPHRYMIDRDESEA